jgi:hypothetical protein
MKKIGNRSFKMTQRFSFFLVSKTVFKNLTLSVIKKGLDNLWGNYIFLEQFLLEKVFNKYRKCSIEIKYQNCLQ